MPTCHKHGIKINWNKDYPNCPACEHLKLETRELQADLTRSRGVLNVLIREAINSLGKKACILCPHFDKPEDGCRASFSTTDGCIDSIREHYTAKAAAEGKDES